MEKNVTHQYPINIDPPEKFTPKPPVGGQSKTKSNATLKQRRVTENIDSTEPSKEKNVVDKNECTINTLHDEQHQQQQNKVDAKQPETKNLPMVTMSSKRRRSSSKLYQHVKPKVPTKHVKSKTAKSRYIDLTPIKQMELEKLSSRLCLLHREYNERRIEISDQKTKLKLLQRELSDLRLNEADLQSKNEELLASGESLKSKEAEIEDMIKVYKRNKEYGDTLKHMVDRDTTANKKQQFNIEFKRKEIDDLRKDIHSQKLQLRDFNSARRTIQSTFLETQKHLKVALNEWKDRVKMRNSQVEETNEIFQLREKQEERRAAIVAEVKGDLDSEGEIQLQRKVVSHKVKQAVITSEIMKKSKQVSEFAIAFKQIAEKTGITDVQDVVDKYLHQEDTNFNLKSMIKEAETRIVKLQDEKESITSELEQIRYSGIGHLNKQRKKIDEKESQISVAEREYNIVSSQAKAVNETIRGICNSVQHIVKHLEDIQIRDGPSTNAIIPYTIDRSNVQSIIQSCEQKLTRLCDVVANVDAEATARLDYPLDVPAHPANVMVKAKAQQNSGDLPGLAEESSSSSLIVGNNIEDLIHLTPGEIAKQQAKMKRNRVAELNGKAQAAVIVGEDGRKALKNEANRLLHFAEKKRHKLLKSALNNPDTTSSTWMGTSSGNSVKSAIEKQVIALTRKEAKRSSLLNPNREVANLVDDDDSVDGKSEQKKSPKHFRFEIATKV